MALVEGCSRTLESLDIARHMRGTSVRHPHPQGSLLKISEKPISTSLNLSNATKLRDVVFRPVSMRVEWITLALQTVGHEHQDLRQFFIRFHPSLNSTPFGQDIRQCMGEGVLEESLDLDRILVHLWESRSIRPSLVCPWMGWVEVGAENRIGTLLPEMVG